MKEIDFRRRRLKVSTHLVIALGSVLPIPFSQSASASDLCAAVQLQGDVYYNHFRRFSSSQSRQLVGLKLKRDLEAAVEAQWIALRRLKGKDVYTRPGSYGAELANHLCSDRDAQGRFPQEPATCKGNPQAPLILPIVEKQHRLLKEMLEGLLQCDFMSSLRETRSGFQLTAEEDALPDPKESSINLPPIRTNNERLSNEQEVTFQRLWLDVLSRLIYEGIDGYNIERGAEEILKPGATIFRSPTKHITYSFEGEELFTISMAQTHGVGVIRVPESLAEQYEGVIGFSFEVKRGVDGKSYKLLRLQPHIDTDMLRVDATHLATSLNSVLTEDLKRLETQAEALRRTAADDVKEATQSTLWRRIIHYTPWVVARVPLGILGGYSSAQLVPNMPMAIQAGVGLTIGTTALMLGGRLFTEPLRPLMETVEQRETRLELKRYEEAVSLIRSFKGKVIKMMNRMKRADVCETQVINTKAETLDRWDSLKSNVHNLLYGP